MSQERHGSTPGVGQGSFGETASVEELAAALALSTADLIATLPQADQDEYRCCVQSVIDARASAWRNEGQMVIG